MAFDPDWATAALPYGDGHDHRDPSHHAGRSTPNFRLLGWDPLITGALGTTATGMMCGGIAQRQDGRQVAVVNTWFTEVAFVLVDVTDPAKPMKLGEFVMENAFAYDADITPDGLHVAIATTVGDLKALDSASDTTALPPTPPEITLTYRNACGDATSLSTPLPLQGGVVLVGIQDPMSPALEDFYPLPIAGAHSVSTAEVDGMTVVLASVANTIHGTSYVQFIEVQDTMLGSRLLPLSVFQAPPSLATTDRPLVDGHLDGAIQKHPIDGRTYAYLAYWDAGVVIADITDLRLPTYVSSFTDFGGGPGYLAGQSDGAVHEVLPIPGTWNGRHYALAGQELVAPPEERTSGWVHLLDTTDPARMTFVGSWTLPVDAEWESGFPLLREDNQEYLLFSPHYLALIDRTLFVTQYHGGVWAVDLSDDATLPNPLSIGVFLPTNESPKPGPPAFSTEPIDYTPAVLEALATPDGNLLVFDAMSGAYVVSFDASTPAPSPPPWSRASL